MKIWGGCRVLLLLDDGMVAELSVVESGCAPSEEALTTEHHIVLLDVEG